MADERTRIITTVLAVLLVAAFLVAWLRVVEERDAEVRLQDAAEALTAGIGRELDRLVEIATAINVALIGREDLDSASYTDLLDQLGVDERYPSLYGASQVVAVPRGELDELVAARQAVDGRFRLRTDAGADELRLIVNVYPRARNALALGVDVTGLPDSFDASERARTSARPALSSVTQLVQLPPGDPGAVLYVPHHEADGSIRRWIGVTFAGDRFLEQLQPLPADVALQVLDPASDRFAGLGAIGTSRSNVSVQVPLDRYGQRWVVEVRPGRGFVPPWPRRASTLAGLGGLLGAVLLSVLVHTLSSRERRAQQIAARRTEELASANTDLAHLNVALLDANAGKDDFLAAVSHELRTPLTVIGGFTDSLRRMRQDPELDVFLDPIDRNVRRLDGLVSDLLTLASLDAGAVEVFPETVDLREIVRLAPSELAGLRDDQVDVAVPELPVVVAADRRHVERILTNLLTNATRHGEPPVELRVGRDGDEVVVRVRDHGPGVDEVLVPQLFHRFVRGPRTDRVAGTGLGLAIVRELAELNGGSATYAAASPGARFEVRLPAADPVDPPGTGQAEGETTVRSSEPAPDPASGRG